MIATKIAAKSLATSRIGSQVKPLAARCSAGLAAIETSAANTRMTSRGTSCSSKRVPRMPKPRPGFHRPDINTAAAPSAALHRRRPIQRIPDRTAHLVVRGEPQTGRQSRTLRARGPRRWALSWCPLFRKRRRLPSRATRCMSPGPWKFGGSRQTEPLPPIAAAAMLALSHK